MEVIERDIIVGTTAEALWKAWFFDEEFQRGINQVFRITFSDIELDHSGSWDDGTLRLHRELNFDTDRDIPKVLLKLVNGVTRVREISELDMAAKRLKVTLRVPVIPSRVDYGYEYRWSEAPGGDLTIHWRGHCHARLPMVGGMAERYLMGELDESTRGGAEFVNRWFSS